MKKVFLALFLVLTGMLITQIPDLINLYADHVSHKYQDKYCKDKGIGPDQCDFSLYFYPYQKDHPKLVEMEEYFQMGNGPLYMILSGKCSTRMFHNPSAAPKDTGKITLRDYFFNHCSKFDDDMDDLIYGK